MPSNFSVCDGWGILRDFLKAILPFSCPSLLLLTSTSVKMLYIEELSSFGKMDHFQSRCFLALNN